MGWQLGKTPANPVTRGSAFFLFSPTEFTSSFERHSVSRVRHEGGGTLLPLGGTDPEVGLKHANASSLVGVQPGEVEPQSVTVDILETARGDRASAHALLDEVALAVRLEGGPKGGDAADGLERVDATVRRLGALGAPRAVQAPEARCERAQRRRHTLRAPSRTPPTHKRRLRPGEGALAEWSRPKEVPKAHYEAWLPRSDQLLVHRHLRGHFASRGRTGRARDTAAAPERRVREVRSWPSR